MQEINAQRGEKADHFETEARDHHDVYMGREVDSGDQSSHWASPKDGYPIRTCV